MDFQSRYSRLQEDDDIQDVRLHTTSSAPYEMSEHLSHLSSSAPEVVGSDYPETLRERSDKFIVKRHQPDVIGPVYGTNTDTSPLARPANTKHRGQWLEVIKKRRVYIEAAFASLVVIAIVVGAVYGTEKQRQASNPPTSNILRPSDSDIPVGKSFNASFAVPAGNCSNTCGSTVSGYTAGVSHNLWGDDTSAQIPWACGTCWHIHAATNSEQQSINSTDITVHVQDLCPATEQNDLCQQADLDSTNKYGAVVHFNLCPETGSIAAFFPAGDGLGIGTATRVDCP